MTVQLDTIRGLREKRKNLQLQGEEILRDIEAARAKKDETREQELVASFEKIHADDQRLKADIERHEQQWDAESERRDGELRDRDREAAEVRGKQPGPVRAGLPDSEGETPDGPTDERRAELIHETSLAFIRGGFSGLTPEQREVYSERMKGLDRDEGAALRAMGVASDTAGGFLVADEMMQQIVSAMTAFGGMRRANTFKFTTGTGADLPIPTDNDTTNTGALLGEGQTAGEQDVTVGQVVMRAYTYHSKIVKVHVNLLQDSAFDIEGWLSGKLGMRIGRITNTHATVGDGAAKPEGVVTGATLGVTGATGQTATIQWTDAQALKHSVDPDYRALGTQWMFSDDTLLKFKQILDGQGRPIWQSGVALKEPDTIDGDEYVINQDVADMEASAKSVLYGYFPAYYMRTVRGVTLIRFGERYMDSLQVGFLAFSRFDGKLVDAGTNPIKYYQNAAS